MALEIKGLKSSMLKVAMRIESLKTKAARFDEVGGKLEADMDSIIAQAEDHTEDLSFAAQVLGNSTSGGSSGEGEHTDLKTEPPQDKAKSEPPAVGEPAKLTVNGIQA